MRLFLCLLRANYFAGSAAGAATGAATGATTFLAAFFAFFAFLAGFFTSFIASAAGAATSAAAAGAAGLTGAAAKATAEKETATRAATIVDRTFFICITSKGICLIKLLQATCQNNIYMQLPVFEGFPTNISLRFRPEAPHPQHTIPHMRQITNFAPHMQPIISFRLSAEFREGKLPVNEAKGLVADYLHQKFTTICSNSAGRSGLLITYPCS
jgi:hypothetical protein